VDAQLASAPRGYRAVWSTFDNATGTTKRIAEVSDITTRLHAPVRLPQRDGDFIQVQLSAIDAPYASWEEPVNAYFRLREGTWRLVGFERMAEQQ